MDLEKRLRRLEDRAAINDLVVAYFLAADGDDFVGVGNTFTENATFSSSGARNAENRGEIVQFIKSAREHMGLTVHTPHYVQLSFEGDENARGLVGAHLELVLGGHAFYGAVRYEDRYVRYEGVWLIDARDMRTIFIAPWTEVGAALASESPVCWPGVQPMRSDYERLVDLASGST